MPDAERLYQFALIRYMPDIVRGEFLNIGVFLADSAEKRMEARMLDDFRRVKRFHPVADIGLLASLEDMFTRGRVENGRDLHAYLEYLQSFSTTLQVSEPKGVLTSNFEAELERLYDTYVREPRYPTRLGAAVERSRAWIRAQLNATLRRAGLLERLNRSVPVEEFTHQGDRFRFDFGWRRNGHRGFLHTLALEREVDRAKVLAYTMERISTRLAAQKLTARCTAVVEAPPAGETAELSARILAEQSIALVPVAGLADFAERLRRELA